MDNMFIENRSKFSLEDTISKLTEAISKSDWKVIHTHDLQQLMRKNGHKVLSVKVIEICAPKFAYKLLSTDNERVYSNMMPCRLSVYEKSDGAVYVSRMNIGKLSLSFGGVVTDVMSDAFRDAEKFIAQVIE